VAQVAEHGLHRGDALAVELAPAWAVDGRSHAIDGLVRVVGNAVMHGDLAQHRLGLSDALRPKLAALAVAGPGRELLALVAPCGVVTAPLLRRVQPAGQVQVLSPCKMKSAEVNKPLTLGLGLPAGLRLSCSTSPLALCLACSA
jgi:hypothetical protein